MLSNSAINAVQNTHYLQIITQIDTIIDTCKQNFSKNIEQCLNDATYTLQLSEKHQYTKGIAYSKYLIGYAYSLHSNYRRARQNLFEAEKYAATLVDKSLLAKVLNTIGNTYNQQGIFDLALSSYFQALDLFKNMQHQVGMGVCFLNIGIVYSHQNGYEKALQFHLQAKEIKEKQANYEKNIGRCYNNIGYLYTQLGFYEKAKFYFKKTQEIIVKYPNKHVQGLLTSNLAQWLSIHKQYHQALNYAKESLQVRKEINDKLGIVKSLRTLGTIYLAKQELLKAIDHYQQSLSLAQKINAQILMQENYRYLAQAYKRLNKLEEVFLYQEKYIALTESLYDSEKSKVLAEMEIRYEIDKKKKEAEIYRLKNVELKRTLDQLRQTQSKLIQTEKMASIGQLTAGIAHEINNPVNFIGANIVPLQRNINFLLQLIEKYERLENPSAIVAFKQAIDYDYTKQEMRNILNGISEGVRRTSEIVQGLRSFSHADNEAPQLFNLHNCIDSTLTLLRSQIVTQSVFVEKHYSNIPLLLGYEGKIKQVCMNILNNAIQALQQQKKPIIVIRTTIRNKQVILEISDNGVGMDDKTQQKIFEPFFTTKDVGSGTGLGLSISFAIIKKHKGSIEVNSSLNKGTHFVITLPI